MNFDKLQHRIDLIPMKELVITHFPQLAEHKEFSNPNHDILLRICIFSTAQGSPFVLHEREDYEKRLVSILEYLKKPDKHLIKGLVDGSNIVFEAMVTRYLMTIDKLAYVMWYDKLRMFHQVGIFLRQPIDADTDMNKRVALDKQREAIYTTLLDYESQIFPDIPTRTKLRQSVAKLLQPAEMFAVNKQVV